jgi:hypothetical protein
MTPHDAKTVLHTVGQYDGSRGGKPIDSVPGDEGDHRNLMSTLHQAFDKESETPFRSTGSVASGVNEENPHKLPRLEDGVDQCRGSDRDLGI